MEQPGSQELPGSLCRASGLLLHLWFAASWWLFAAMNLHIHGAKLAQVGPNFRREATFPGIFQLSRTNFGNSSREMELKDSGNTRHSLSSFLEPS